MNLRRTIGLILDHHRDRDRLIRELDAAAMDGLRAQDLAQDRTSGHTTVLDDDGFAMPAVADPTGETATSPDPIRALRHDLDLAEHAVYTAASSLYGVAPTSFRHIATLVDLHRRQGPDPLQVHRIISATETLADIRSHFLCHCGHPHRCPSHTTITDADYAAMLAKVSNDNAPVCAFCGNEPPRHKNPTTVSGNLPEPRWVGSSCYDRIRKTGHAPSRQDLEKLKRTGHWPKLREKAA